MCSILQFWCNVIRHLKQDDAFSRTWWSALSIDKLVTWQHLSIERIGGHVLLKASSCLRSLLSAERRRLIVNSVRLEILSLVFLIGAFLANTSLDWFVRNVASFLKINKNKSGMPPEFVYLWLVGKRCCFIQLVIENKSQDLLLVCKGDSHTTRSAQNATKAE